MPSFGGFVSAVRGSGSMCRSSAKITINSGPVKRLLASASFLGTFPRLRVAHGMSLPLSFSSVLAELNVLCTLSLLNFASGYRVPLHEATGRGAFDSIRALVFSMYISSDTDGDLLSATGMQNIEEGKVAELMNVANKVHQEKPHKDLPGIMVGELGGPIWEVVQLITKVLRETGDVLVKGGYPNLGAFVLEALKEGEKARQRAAPTDVDPECDVILERVRCSFMFLW
ncbi:hypothetical protein QCA50_011701 [Cerrena zonata]|uniref:Uncharacterized protein n=1 Tax=Cerrena zonata TaxID=2478898 RepID=A0AAW0G1D6_9APHY